MCEMCCGKGISRRDFMAAAAGAGMIGGMMTQVAGAQAAPEAPETPDQWPEVRVAYLRPKEKYWLGWPGTSFDVDGFLKRTREQVEGFARELKVRVVFEPEPLYDAAAAEAFAAKVKAEKPKGVLLFPLHMQHWPRTATAAKTGVPTVIFAALGMCFTGHIQALSKEPGVYLASSADPELKPVRFGLKMIRTAHELRRMKIAVVAGKESKEVISEPLGITLRYVPRARFPEIFKTIEATAEVRAVAEDYTKSARKIVEPSAEDILNASKNYFTALQILKEEGCHGITMDCLGLVRDRQIPCPPCMAWSKLLDVGLLGVCEADIRAVLGNALCIKLLDKPGFMQDPVPETVNNTFIGAHCVSPTRLDGFDKPRAPFILRSHSESDLGVSLQVIWEPGREVTVMQFEKPDTMILGKGKVLRNLDTPPWGGCRTSVELAIDGPAETRDTRGFHQLFIAGDHVRDFKAYGQMYGITVEHI